MNRNFLYRRKLGFIIVFIRTWWLPLAHGQTICLLAGVLVKCCAVQMNRSRESKPVLTHGRIIRDDIYLLKLPILYQLIHRD